MTSPPAPALVVPSNHDSPLAENFKDMTVPRLSNEPSSAGSDTTAIASSRTREEKTKAGGGELELDRRREEINEKFDLEGGKVEEDKQVVKKPW